MVSPTFLAGRVKDTIDRMPRKSRPFLTSVDSGVTMRELDDDDDDDDGPPCLLCTLIDNDDEEPLRDRLARALAYGTLVLAKKGQGVSTCEACHEAVAAELDELTRELRAAKRAARG